jgi:hypothetical protein
MKTKLTLSVDEALVRETKRYASRKGLSLSQVVESALRDLAGSVVSAGSFAGRWRGRFAPARKDSARYRHLRRQYL